MQQKGLLSHRLISGLKSKALKSVQDSFCSADEGGREKKKSKNVHQKKKNPRFQLIRLASLQTRTGVSH